MLPDMTDGSGEIRHLAVGAGKDSNIYLVDRDNMGKFVPGATSNSYIYQELVGGLPGGEFATAAYFNGSIYYGPVGGALRRFTITQARLDAAPAAITSTVFAYPGVTPRNLRDLTCPSFAFWFLCGKPDGAFLVAAYVHWRFCARRPGTLTVWRQSVS